MLFTKPKNKPNSINIESKRTQHKRLTSSVAHFRLANKTAEIIWGGQTPHVGFANLHECINQNILFA